MMRRHHLRSVMCVVGVGIWLLSAGPACAQLTSSSIQQLTERRVSLDEIPRWINDQWQVLNRSEWNRLLAAARENLNRPGVGRIRSASYEATLVGSELVSGSLAWNLERLEPAPVLFALDPMQIPVSLLRWRDAQAVWGTTQSGSTVLYLDRPMGTVSGRWSLNGRKLRTSVEFELKLAPAEATTIELRLPRGRQLRSTRGMVEQLLDDRPGNEWSTWRVRLGRAYECSLIVSDTAGESNVPPVLLTEQTSRYVVQDEGIELEEDLSITVLNAPIDRVELRLPRRVQVFAVTYGVDTALEWTAKVEQGEQRLTVALPDSVSGTLRRIRVEAFLPLRLNAIFKLPRIAVFGGVFQAGQVQLDVLRPLHLTEFRARGLFQTRAVLDAAVAESVSFEQFLPNSQLIIRVGTPATRTKAQVFTHIQFSSDAWKLRSQTILTGVSGQQFVCRSQIERGWKITGVRLPPGTRETQIVYWNSVPRRDGRSILTIEFSNALAIGQPRAVLLEASRIRGQSSQTMSIPVVRPLQSAELQNTIAVTAPSDVIREPLTSGEGYRVITTGEAPDYARDSFFWDGVVGGLAESTLLQSESGFAKRELRLDSDPNTLTAGATVQVNVTEQRIESRLAIQVRPLDVPINRVQVFVSARDQVQSWTYSGIDEQVIEARRLVRAESAERDLPESGELWEFTFAQPIGHPFEFRATVANRRETLNRIPLPVIPGIRGFTGTVQLPIETATNLNVQVTGLQQPDAEQADQEWVYSNATATMLLRNQESRQDPRIADLELRSQIVIDADSYDIHWSRFTLRGWSAADFQFELSTPAQLITTRVNGVVSQPVVRENRFLLNNLFEGRQNIVEIEYRTPSQVGFLKSSRQIIIPQTDHEILRFHWDFALPSDYSVVDDFDSIQLTVSPDARSWTARLFGPLGQARSKSIFNPFDPESWLAQPVSSDRTREVMERSAWQPQTTGWTVWHATGHRSPEMLTLSAVDQRRTTLCSWLAVMTTFLIGITIRVIQLGHRLRIGAIWLLTVLAVSILATPHWGAISGGAVIGTLLSSLLPRTLIAWIHRSFANHRSDPGTVVSRSQMPSTTAGIGLMVCLLTGISAAQSPLLGEAKRGQAKMTDVLVPESSDANAVSQTVYVHSETLDLVTRLARADHRPEQYLIRDAQYRCQLIGTAPLIEAVYQIAVLSSQDAVSVELPIHGANLGGPGACRVNGQVAAAVRSRDGKSLVVRLERSQDRESVVPVPLGPLIQQTEDDDSNAPQAGRDFPIPYRPVEMFEVQLALFPPTAGSASQEQIELEVPPVASSVLLIEADAARPFVRVASESRVTELDLTDDEDSPGASEPQVVPIGRSSRFRLQWSSARESTDATREWSGQVDTLVDVAFSSLRFESRIRLTPQSGLLKELVFQIPSDAIAVELDCPGVLSQTSVKDGEQRKLIVEFDQPRAEAVDATLRYLLPRSRPETQVLVPTPILLPAAPGLQKVSHRFGVRAASSFVLKQQPSDTAGATMLVEPMVVGDQRAQYSYEIQSDGFLQFELAVKQPLRRVYQNHEARIRSYGIDWLLTAEIQTEETAAFFHRMTVDARIQIEAISIQEDGAERLVRWERNGTDLMLYLSGKTQGLQNLTLRGHMPLGMREQTQLPSLQFPEAETVESTLDVYYDPELQVQIVSDEDWDLDETTNDARSAADVLLGRVDLKDLSRAPSVLVRRQVRSIRVNSLLSVWPDDARTWNWNADFQFPNAEQRPGRFRISIPVELAASLEVSSADVPNRVIDRPDGGKTVVIGPFSDPFAVSRLQLRSRWEIPDPTSIALPQVEYSHQPDGSAYLVVGSIDGVDLLSDRVQSVGVKDLPSWMQEQTTGFGTTRTIDRFRLAGVLDQSVKMVSRVQSRNRPQSEIALFETDIRMDANGNLQGITRILPTFGERTAALQLRWPEDLELRTVFLNERPWPTNWDQDETLLRVASDADSGLFPEVIEVHWMRESPASQPFRKQRISIPVPDGEIVRHALVRISVSGERQVLVQQGLESNGRGAFLGERLDALMELAEQQFLFGDPQEWTWQQLLNSRRIARMELERSIGYRWTPGEISTLEEKLAEIDERIAAIQTPFAEVSRADGGPLQRQLSGRRITDSRIAVGASRIEGNEVTSEIEFWLVDDRLPLATALAIACPFFTWVVWRLARPRCADWLGARPGIAWIVIGTVWWLCLRPSVLGLPLILFGVWLLTQMQKDPEEASTHLHEPTEIA